MFTDYLQKFNRQAKKRAKLPLFCDIETYQFNKDAGREKPTAYKNQVFSVCVGWYDNNELHLDHSYSNFIDFFRDIDTILTKKVRVQLFFHNGKKYDHHYLEMQLIHAFPDLQIKNQWLRNVDIKAQTPIKKIGKQTILEKRVKAKTSLDLTFCLTNQNVIYETVDTLPKFNGMGIRDIGISLNKVGLLPDDKLKTDFAYEKYDLDEDLDYWQSYDRAVKIHQQLNQQQLTYIDNDVIILATAYHNFDKLFPGFDKTKITFSQNVMAEYLINPLAQFQLKLQVRKLHLKYSDYYFKDENLYTYLKKFYKGGLNFYNDQYVGQIVTDKINSYDLNSSYPTVMWQEKIPTYLVNFSEAPKVIKINFNRNYWSLYEISKDEWRRLLSKIPSVLIRKLLTKYYHTRFEHVYINKNTIRVINLFADEPVSVIKTLAFITFECHEFGGKPVLQQNYATKTQGKNDNVVDASDPEHIVVTNHPNHRELNKREIYNAKVTLNGIYGLPGIRPAYNYFYRDDDEQLENLKNGFENSERNVVFSEFVTSQALYNLLFPIRHLAAQEIDDNVLYGDTDSLYIKQAVDSKIDKTYFNQYNLGSFKIEHHIDQFYALNHKKYAYHDYQEDKNYVHAGGINLDSFDLNVPFKDLIKYQFHDGVEIKNLKSILTSMGTIALYPSTTKLEKGKSYPVMMSPLDDVKYQALVKEAQQMLKSDAYNNMGEQLMYFETPYGTLSISDVNGGNEKNNQQYDIMKLIENMYYVKKTIGRSK